MALQCETASGKVLEETYRKWVQYKEDCVRMIENEPFLQGTNSRPQLILQMASGGRGEERETWLFVGLSS